jgi:tRNA A58 N-methylase Trm61
VDAVAGARGSAQVYVSTKHGPIPTDVVVGASNGVMIEIKSGVTLGTKVIVPSPSLLDGP